MNPQPDLRPTPSVPPPRPWRPLALALAVALGTSAACGDEDLWDPADAPDADGGGDVEGDARPDAGPDADAGAEAEADAGGPWVRIVSPADGGEEPNPVTFVWEAGGGVATVAFEADGWPLQREPLPADLGSHTYEFSGVNFVRRVVLTGYDAAGAPVATDEIDVTPTEEFCRIPDVPGFNHYTVAAINDGDRYPKDGTYPYCWAGRGDVCVERWGMVHDAWYGGELLFSGGGDCFCSGHTLEIFLRSYRLWQLDNGIAESVAHQVDGRVLTTRDVSGGSFYQHWQGYGVASDASAANAFEWAGIGENLWSDRWDEARPGDYANISRSTGSGHAVIFMGWVEDAGEKIGIRYYGCNTRGHSCPDYDDPYDTTGNSGPAFVTEYFDGYGGTVLPRYVYIGRAWLPTP